MRLSGAPARRWCPTADGCDVAGLLAGSRPPSRRFGWPPPREENLLARSAAPMLGVASGSRLQSQRHVVCLPPGLAALYASALLPAPGHSLQPLRPRAPTRRWSPPASVLLSSQDHAARLLPRRGRLAAALVPACSLNASRGLQRAAGALRLASAASRDPARPLPRRGRRAATPVPSLSP